MKRNRTMLIVSLIFLMLSISLIGVAAAGTPGSNEDPVVTKSYVDAKINEIKESVSSASTGKGVDWVVINVESGKKVLGGEGTEMILRGGQATALDNGKDGISDLTIGQDLKGEHEITMNHLLLIPREDGRGIHTKSNCWIMIKGSYKLQ